jgi:hypothetical protein
MVRPPIYFLLNYFQKPILAYCPVLAKQRAGLEEMGVTAPIVRILCAEDSSDVMLGMACWALSNLNADGPTPAIQEAPLPDLSPPGQIS